MDRNERKRCPCGYCESSPAEQVETTENIVTCEECGCIIEDDDYYTKGEVVYCEDCFYSNFASCEACGEIVECEEITRTVKDYFICSYCRDRYYTECPECEEIYHNNDIISDSCGREMCQSCFGYDFYVCEECGCFVHRDSVIFDRHDAALCEDCYNYCCKNDNIHDYSYKPIPIFYNLTRGRNPRYFGVELEVDDGGKDEDNAGDILEIANGYKDRIYIKDDGSLSDGFEIVSHPMSLLYHAEEMPWETICKKAVEMGYRSHDTTTCGLHIHVNRDSLGEDSTEQDETIGKIIYIVESFWDEFVKFSRRDYHNIEKWAENYGKKESVKDTFDNAKNQYTRYHAVNLCNSNTIEFRLFRGTLKYDTILATLEMVDLICTYAMESCEPWLESCTWFDFTRDIKVDKYPHLLPYMEKRGLV